MEIKIDTYCGRCGNRGMKRETRSLKNEDQIHVIYSCLNSDCNRAEVTILQSEGSLYNRPAIGSTFTISKNKIEERYNPELGDKNGK